MSNSVAPLPTGTGVTVIADHRPPRDQDGRHPPEDEHAAGADNPDGGRDRPHQDAPPPIIDDEIVPAETLFAATLMANELPHRLPSPGEIRLRTSHEWAPPDSSLRLKDRLI